MRNLISILLLTFLIGCNAKSDKEEVIDFVHEKSTIKLPDDFEVIINELHGEYQTNDSDYDRNVHLKFSGKSLKELISSLKGSWNQEDGKYIFNAEIGLTNMSLDTITGDFYIEYFE